MRLHARHTHPDYDPRMARKLAAVMLDGVKVERCVYADDEEGFVLELTRAGPGYGRVEEIRRDGKVEFVWKEGAQP